MVKFLKQFFYFIFNINLGDSSFGFILPPDQAPGVCNETYIGMKVFLNGIKKEVEPTLNG